MVITKITEVLNGREKKSTPWDEYLNQKNNKNVQKQEDCISCRIVSGGGLAFLGFYTMLQARKVSHTNLIRKKLHAALIVIAGVLLGGLGLARLFNQRIPDSLMKLDQKMR